ncbi:MAG: hypothetical protein NZ518_09245 [Dehalococcoidia bacterium]|nr:hypothetical protein [Dehalococcoidia bacterium]
MTTERVSRERMRVAIALLAPYVDAALALIPEREFTTRQFMMALREHPEAQAAYAQALSQWPEEDRKLALLTVHGIVAGRVLRASPNVQWVGYVGGYTVEDDGIHVPAKWRKVHDAR